MNRIQPGPLYEKVKAYIIERINDGRWGPGTRIPSENQLSEIMGVSRMTSNRALRELAGEGLLVRLQGVGTFVAEKKPLSAFLEIRSIRDEIKSRGGEHTSSLHLFAKEAAGAELALEMNIKRGGKVFHAVIVHRDRGVPVQLADRFVNPAVAPGFLDQDFSVVTPSEYLLSVAPVSEVEHIAEAVMPDQKTWELLEMDPGEPCLVLQRKTRTMGAVATISRLVYPGPRYRLGGRFKPFPGAGSRSPYKKTGRIR